MTRREYRRRYDLIARHHLGFYREHGRNPWMGQEPQLREWTVRKVREWVPPGATVLDAGCGIGLMLADLAAHYQAVGADLSADYVEYARTELGVDARVAWLERLPFPADTFDAAVCCDVMEHLLNPAAVLTELRRVVKPEGALVVRVPDGDHTHVGADSGFGFVVHLQSWDAEQLAEFLGGTPLGHEAWEHELVMGVRL